MVAAVLGLKFRTQRHILQREWWRILIVVSGALWSMLVLPWSVWAANALHDQSGDVREDALVAIALVVSIGWVVVPILITGLDDTLDPGRFASFGVRARTIMPGLVIAALLTVPVAFFTAMFVLLCLSWLDGAVTTMLVALIGALLTVASLVFGARVASMWATRVLASRRARGAALAVMVGSLALMAPLAWVLFRDGLDAVLEYDLVVLLDQLALTPLGAGMSAPAVALAGDTWGAVWRLAMMAAWVIALLGAWRANVDYSLVHPRFRGAGTRRRDDSIVGAGQRQWFAKRPAWSRLSPIAATVRARLLRYWFSDPRYLANMLGVLAFPVVFFVIVVPIAGLDARWSFVAPVMLAASIGWGRHNDIAYDSSALWLDVVSGRIGVDVMRGRMSAVMAWALPATALGCLAVVLWSGLWAVGLALLGACVGVLGLTLAISALSSVLVPYRAPAPGENPLGAEVGSVGAGLFAQLASSVATVVLLPLVLLPLALALTVDPRWAWLAAASGFVLGPVAYLMGVRWAGRLYDARSGKLLASVT